VLEGQCLPLAVLAKKTTQLIVEGGNDYIITVRTINPRLLAQIKTKAELHCQCERLVDVEKCGGL